MSSILDSKHKISLLKYINWFLMDEIHSEL